VGGKEKGKAFRTAVLLAHGKKKKKRVVEKARGKWKECQDMRGWNVKLRNEQSDAKKQNGSSVVFGRPWVEKGEDLYHMLERGAGGRKGGGGECT